MTHENESAPWWRKKGYRDRTQAKTWKANNFRVAKAVKSGNSTAGQISKAAKLSKTSVYPHLLELAEKGKIVHDGKAWIARGAEDLEPALLHLALLGPPSCKVCMRSEETEQRKLRRLYPDYDRILGLVAGSDLGAPLPINETVFRNFFLISRLRLWGKHISDHENPSMSRHRKYLKILRPLLLELARETRGTLEQSIDSSSQKDLRAAR